MILAGIDEAGLGPALGPLCVACAALRFDGESAEDGPWSFLDVAVARTRARGDARLLVADSKIAHRKNDPSVLERTVLAFCAAADDGRPDSRESFLENLGAREAVAAHDACPWYRDRAWSVPGWLDPERWADDTGRLRAACAEAGAAVAGVWANPVLAHQLNRRFDGGLNKSEALLAETGARLAALDAAFPGEPILVTVDKQGGRNAYVPFLMSVFPGAWIDTEAEGPERSEYVVRRGGGSMRIRFRPRADGAAFCVALASMTAKYLRERYMDDLNAWFAERVPGLKPTAGYHGDAPRWLEAVAEVLAAEGIDRALLVRAR